MEPWISRNNATKQTVLLLACCAAGLALLVGFREFGRSGASGRAGVLLGVLLLVIGVAGLVTGGRQSVVVDPGTRRITVETAGVAGTRRKTIEFSDVAGVGLGYLGRRSSGVTFYYLVLHLRAGGEFSLFGPGRFFPGGSNRSTVDAWRQRLEGYLAR